MHTFPKLNGIVKKAEPCKYDICVISSIILWHKRVILSLKEWRFSCLILTSDFPPWYLLYKFIQHHFSEVCLFSLEKTCDVECLKPIRSKLLWNYIIWKWELIHSIKCWRTQKKLHKELQIGRSRVYIFVSFK